MSKFSNIFDKSVTLLYNKFKNDSAKMLIYTGAIALITSCVAQCFAIIGNKKISKEKRNFLLPQEIADGAISVLNFIISTLFVKKTTKKLFNTGKFAPKTVRQFLDKNKELYKDKIGKVDFELVSKPVEVEKGKFLDTKSILKAGTPERRDFEACSEFWTTVATVGTSIVSCNIITPLLRNNYAAYKQDNLNKRNASAISENKVRLINTFTNKIPGMKI